MRSQTTRTISGTVNADGTIKNTAGGFAVQKTGTGIYRVILLGTVRLISVTVSSAIGGINRAADAIVVDDHTISVQMQTVNPNAASDQPFAFIATVVA
jgi:hypothetical protein